jgi:hypothetical protein
MRSSSSAVRLPSFDETIAPVTILDGLGHVVRVVPATEFRRPEPASPGLRGERRRRLSRPVAVKHRA